MPTFLTMSLTLYSSPFFIKNCFAVFKLSELINLTYSCLSKVSLHISELQEVCGIPIFSNKDENSPVSPGEP